MDSNGKANLNELEIDSSMLLAHNCSVISFVNNEFLK